MEKIVMTESENPHVIKARQAVKSLIKAQQAVKSLGKAMALMEKSFREFGVAMTKAYWVMMAMLFCSKCGAKGSMEPVSGHYVRCRECGCRSLFKTVLQFNKEVMEGHC